GSTAMVSWQVRADAVGGQIINVDGYSSSLGETFLDNSGNIIVVVQDVELPLILNVTALPSPQEVYGVVNISSLVLDNTGVQQVKAVITNPDLSPYGNLSMALDPGTGRYFYLDSYTDLGVYTFDLWAEDINGNWNTTSGSFTMQDTTPPEINNVMAIPSPQEVFGSVNISADVTDNFLLSNVGVEITDPLSSVTNFIMTNGLFDNYFHYDNYNLLGTYDFVIEAIDSMGIWTLSTGQFVIQDSTFPIANAGPDQYDVLIETVVNFDGSLSSDNYGIASHVWTFIDGTSQTLMGATPQYTFLIASCYDVTLNVTDIPGNYATDVMRVCTIERNPPLIQNVMEIPNPQEIYGFVNVSADVWDDYGLVDVWIEIISPDMTSTNVSMTSGPGDQFYYRRMYSALGTYDYTIWALDVYDNWNFSAGSFLIDDWTPPDLSNVGINPSTQQIHGSINITVFVTDNHQVGQVLINITDPDGMMYTNTTMSFFTLALQHFYRDFYHKLGTYNFTMWASDFSGNWNST
ncbi:MAG: PKD domain-containing protein, partial [Thermoplasmata archaeon]|nr:PKD domain-containing protein [Thermoplasmata archaeon]